MDAVRNVRETLADKRFRAAVVLGVVSIPFTIGVNWVLTPDTVEATPLAVACVGTGYLYGSRSVNSTRAGMLTGVVGGTPLVVRELWTTLVGSWRYFSMIHTIDDSVLLAMLSLGVTLLGLVVFSVVLLVIGWSGGAVGGWLSGHVDPARLIGSSG